MISQDSLNSISYFTIGSIVVTTITSTFGTMIGFSSSQGVWGLFNQYQLILMLPFLRTNLSKDFFVFMSNFKFITFDFSFMEDVSLQKLLNFKDVFDYEQTDEVYSDNGLESGSFLVNQFNVFQTILLILFLHASWLLASKMINWSWSKLKNLKKKMSNFFHFQTYIRFVIESFLFGFLAAFTEAISYDKIATKSIPIQSYLIGWSFTILFFAFIFFMIVMYIKKKEKNAESEYLAELYDSFKNKHFAKIYFIVFCARRVVIVLVVVLWK